MIEFVSSVELFFNFFVVFVVGKMIKNVYFSVWLLSFRYIKYLRIEYDYDIYYLFIN